MRRLWTEQETKILDNNRRMPIKRLALLLNRTETAIKQKKHQLGIGRHDMRVPERFSQEEKILRLHAIMAKGNIKLYGD